MCIKQIEARGQLLQKKGKKENLFDDNNQLEYPYIEKNDSRYISLGRSFAVLI